MISHSKRRRMDIETVAATVVFGVFFLILLFGHELVGAKYECPKPFDNGMTLWSCPKEIGR